MRDEDARSLREAIFRDFNAGLLISEIRRRNGVSSYALVYEALTIMGADVAGYKRTHGLIRRGPFSVEDIAEIKRLYLDEKWSIAKLRSHYGCRDSRISNLLRQAGIAIRAEILVENTEEEIRQTVAKAFAAGEGKRVIEKRLGIAHRRATYIIDDYACNHDDDIAKAIRNRLEERKQRFAGQSTKDIYLTAFKCWKHNAKERGIPWDLSIEDLQYIWDKQDGKCHYTQVPMVSYATNAERNANRNHIRLASLDRVDSDRGYTLDNVVFCCCGINLGKSDWSKEEFESLLDDICKLRHCSGRDEIRMTTEDSLIA